MLITINTDASWRDKFAGYAFWIVCDAGKIQKAGKIKILVDNSGEAEMMCIANALHTLKHSRFSEITKVIINTDSQHCIDRLSPGGKFTGKTTEECLFTMMEICLKLGKSIRDIHSVFEFRHVKAHSGKKDNRSFVNEWCDREAKRYSKELLTASRKKVKI
jgi:ribonuclease HI